MKRLVAALAAASVLATTSPAHAFHCSGRATPPERYEGRGTKDNVAGWWLHHDLDERWVGIHYTDGYAYADASDPQRAELSLFVPWWPRFIGARVVAHPDEQPCVEFGKGHP